MALNGIWPISYEWLGLYEIGWNDSFLYNLQIAEVCRTMVSTDNRKKSDILAGSMFLNIIVSKVVCFLKTFTFYVIFEYFWCFFINVRVTTQLIVPLHLESLAGKYKEYIIDDVVVVMILKYVTSFFYIFFPIFSAWQRT